jgi:hypothetical protein
MMTAVVNAPSELRYVQLCRDNWWRTSPRTRGRKHHSFGHNLVSQTWRSVSPTPSAAVSNDRRGLQFAESKGEARS